LAIFFSDLLVEDEPIVALKSVKRPGKVHGAQLVNYLAATGIEVGLLINFGSTGVDVKRKYRTEKGKQCVADRSGPDLIGVLTSAKRMRVSGRSSGAD
jgi:hypothetical protein